MITEFPCLMAVKDNKDGKPYLSIQEDHLTQLVMKDRDQFYVQWHSWHDKGDRTPHILLHKVPRNYNSRHQVSTLMRHSAHCFRLALPCAHIHFKRMPVTETRIRMLQNDDYEVDLPPILIRRKTKYAGKDLGINPIIGPEVRVHPTRHAKAKLIQRITEGLKEWTAELEKLRSRI